MMTLEEAVATLNACEDIAQVFKELGRYATENVTFDHGFDRCRTCPVARYLEARTGRAILVTYLNNDRTQPVMAYDPSDMEVPGEELSPIVKDYIARADAEWRNDECPQ